MADDFFRITNTVALLAWVALLVRPGDRRVSGLLCAVLVPGALAAAYAAVIGWRLFSGGGEGGDPTTIAGLQAIFADDWVVAAAWTHYLVFDMVVGAWIARDAVRLSIPWPLRTLALLFTFLLGPAGFLLHLATRWARAGEIAVGDRA